MNRKLLLLAAVPVFMLLPAAAPQPGSIVLADASPAEVLAAYEREKPGAPMAKGQWEVRYEVTAFDLPGMAAGPERDAQIAAAKGNSDVKSLCQDGGDQSAPKPSLFEMVGKDCHYDSIRMGGGTFEAKLKCAGPQGEAIATSATGSYDPDRFSIDLDIAVEPRSASGQARRSTIRISGHPVGACTTQGRE